jgi:2-amino-4-hydroxy-6-hydroxymethyldihydropteridine diphosphokinase
VFLSLGSNVGRRPDNLRKALEFIVREPGIRVIRASLLYSTTPVGYTAQRKFINGALELRTSLGPRELLSRLEKIEVRMGKSTPFRDGPRRIDIDVVLYGQRRILEDGLVIPHPRMPGRRFVLEPLTEIAARAIHPGLRQTVAQILAGLGPDEEVRPWGSWVSVGR